MSKVVSDTYLTGVILRTNDGGVPI